MTNKSENISLFFKEGSSDKYYKASLVQEKTGYVVNFEYGRTGQVGTTGTKTPTSLHYDIAKRVYEKLIKEKKTKGYKVSLGDSSTVHTEDKEDTGLRPQLLNSISVEEVERYIKDPAYCSEEKFDGRRRMLIKTGDNVVATNKKGLTVVAGDKIMYTLASFPKDIILDGEDMGDHVRVFDALKIEGRDISTLAYQVRYIHLETLLVGHKSLRVVETAWTEKAKRRMYNELKTANAEGIVFKDIRAPYSAGRPNSYGPQLKYKFVESASCIVSDRNKAKRSISLQVFDGAKLVNVGNATVYPNQAIPDVGDVVEVKYLYWHKSGSLFQPVLLGTRDDITREECIIEQLKEKRDE